MSNIAIKAENLSKAYQLGEFSTGTLSRDIERWWTMLRGKEDPFLTIGETNDRSQKGNSDVVWSLKDLNFEIEQGDAVGIIGRNGAGKSTLLKVLSRVTTPTTGSVKVKGRIASLLEVGTGFHPELTGRENIYLNGAILGMRKAEIKKHFDAIVDFAGVERYIDTPVKRYSSGMYVRLAFAVAAHLESEILIVDEVLAVGDAEFQKKCLGKMGEVSKGEGRTVLFVSHNMAAVSSLCNTGIILKNGMLYESGEINTIVNNYAKIGEGVSGHTYDDSLPKANKKLMLRGVRVLNQLHQTVSEIDNAHLAFVEIIFEVIIEGRGYDVAFEIVHTNYGHIFASAIKDVNPASNDSMMLKKGLHKYIIELPMSYLRGGDYIISAAAAIPKIEILDHYQFETYFTVVDTISPVAKTSEGRRGAILPVLKWASAEN